MRHWQFWSRTLVLAIQYNPPEFIEHLMIFGTLILGMRWMFTAHWPYLLLSSNLALGAAASIWVRETLTPSHRPRLLMVFAVVTLLIYSVYGFADIARYYF